MKWKWKTLGPGESVEIGRADISKAHRAAYYYRHHAKPRRDIRVKRIAKGHWILIRRPEQKPSENRLQDSSAVLQT